MVDFLKKYQIELLNQREKVQVAISDLQNKKKEDEKFLQLLKQDNDSVFTEFSPREVNYKNQIQIQDLELTLSSLQKEMDGLERQRQQLDDRIQEIDQLFVNEGDFHMKSTNDSSAQYFISAGDITSKEELIEVIDRIDSYILSDPMRAKMELLELRQIVNK